MKTIWKYKLRAVDTQTILIPNGADILYVATQHGEPHIWARVDPDRSMVQRTIRAHGTGALVTETTGDHIGSFQLEGGDLIFHVFEDA